MNKTSTPSLQPHEVLKGWGGTSAPGRELRGEDLHALTKRAALSRGLGRSYGDASLPPAGVTEVVGTTMANRLLAFDEATGVLRAEAGLALHDLARVFLPKGWFSPVSPGTWFVTLGGMVASDIHGKNHHVAGTIGRYVEAITLRVASGDIVTCSRTEHPELFFATQGGMGLTGHILDVTVRLQKLATPWIWRENLRVANFDELITGLEESSADWPQTVAWIDTLSSGANFGRGHLMRGRWAEPHEAPPGLPTTGFSPTVPIDAPSWVLNDLTVKAFNAAYYWRQPYRFREGPVTPHSWFTPLDAIHNWSRAYGKRGFTQHQAVIPREAGRAKVREFLEILVKRGGTGFLCVLKDCGEEDEGLLSFPKPGISCALDLPVNDTVQSLVDELNKFVLDVGGRIYLTKDAFTKRSHFEQMEADRLDRFRQVRHTWDPNLTIRSGMSVRLFGDPE